MSEMVKQVARALQAVAGRHDLHIGWELRNALARAAIEAMREPNRHMIEAGDAFQTTLATWRSMIDEALE